MRISFSTEDIIGIVQPLKTAGSTGHALEGLAALADAGPGDVAFLGNPKYRDAVPACHASLVLVPRDYEGTPNKDQVYLWCENPSLALARLCRRIETLLWPRPKPGIHPSAVVSASARIGPDVSIGACCVLEEDAVIGDGTVLEAGVFVGRGAVIGAGSRLMVRSIVMGGCRLGLRVQLQPGAVIGADGFGYDSSGGRHEKIPQIGIVELGDDVEIGANTTIDRARFSRTVVGEGTKIDNLVQIGHNVVIGRHCLIVSQAGIAGSTTLGDNVIVGGQAGLAGHIKIGAGAHIGGQSGVPGDLEPGAYVWGTTAIPYLLECKVVLLRRRIPELFKRVDRLEAEIRRMETA